MAAAHRNSRLLVPRTLMADAGLTNGAFYAHFASKDDLVATTVADQRESLFPRYRWRNSRPWR
jgi:AcrR family transcriptional regulator